MNHVDKPEVAPLVLARVSAQSPLDLDSLILTTTVGAIEAALAAEAELGALTLPVTEALYALVPQLDDNRPLRRAVLALKRDLHKGRPISCNEEQQQAIADHLSPEMAHTFLALLAAFRQRDGSTAEGERLFSTEILEAGEALVRLLANPDLQQGLALASPDFLESLLRNRVRDAHPDSRFARTCVAYLTRAAVKTSPFSTLTRIGTARFDQDTNRPVRLPGNYSYVTRAFATALLMACARDARLSQAFLYEPNQGIRQAGTGATILLSDYQCVSGFFWRQERCVNANAYVGQIEQVRHLSRSSYSAWLEALGGPTAHATFARLLAIGIVRPIAPWSSSNSDAFGPLADALSTLDGSFPQQCASLLRQLSTLAKSVEESDGARRCQIQTTIRDRVREGFALTGQPAPAWVNSAGVVYEDCPVQHPLPALGELVKEDLLRLGEIMRPYMVRTRLYDHLADHFVKEFGSGGISRDVMAFLMGFLSRPDAMTLMNHSMREDGEAMGKADHASSGASVGTGTLPPAASVFFQIVASCPEAVRRGDYLLVVNHYNPGFGGVFARFNPLFEADPAHTKALREWILSLYPGASVHELQVAADWNSLQFRGGRMFPHLQWPGEGATASSEAYLNLRELSLQHDPKSGTLGLVGPDGKPVALTYQGVIPPYFTTGPLRLLFVLMDPWLNGHRIGWTPRPSDAPPPRPQGVERSERLVEGRLVLRRARWRVPPGDFPVQTPGESDFAYLHRANRWRRDHAIPREVFATAERRSLSFEARKRKPMWLRFDCLHSLMACRQLLGDDVLALSLTEALPGRDDHWVRGEDSLPRAAEFQALLQWPAPSQKGGGSV